MPPNSVCACLSGFWEPRLGKSSKAVYCLECSGAWSSKKINRTVFCLHQRTQVDGTYKFPSARVPRDSLVFFFIRMYSGFSFAAAIMGVVATSFWFRSCASTKWSQCQQLYQYIHPSWCTRWQSMCWSWIVSWTTAVYIPGMHQVRARHTVWETHEYQYYRLNLLDLFVLLL